MKVNINELKSLTEREVKFILIDIIMAYKYSEYPEDLEHEVGNILKLNNLVYQE